MNWLKGNKYHNEKVTVDGITFDSKREAARWSELLLMQRAGEITGLARQVRIEVIPKTKLYRASTYVADFVYFDKKANKTVYEDVKGYKEGLAYQHFKLKQKTLYWRYGIEVKEV